MEKEQMLELAELVATAVVTALEKKNIIGNGATNEPKKSEKTAYQKTEQLLYNYRAFQKIVAERMAEIETLRKYGVPQRSTSIVEYSSNGGGIVGGLVLPEDSVESAVRTVQASVEGTVQAIALIDKAMAALRSDPYYRILEMRYFEGRTQEDIALEFNCSQMNISKNKSRLVRELTMRIFPNQVIEELMH